MQHRCQPSNKPGKHWPSVCYSNDASRGTALEISSFRKIEERSLVQETAQRLKTRLKEEGPQQIR
jgi:hypothetical protein